MTVTATLPAGVASPKPHSVAISDDKSAELVEAVAALKMEKAATTPKRPSAAQIQVDGPGEIDSGYASKSSTPENSNFGPFVVANTPLLSITRRKKTRLTHFEKDIPKPTQNRFEDLRELYADSLNNLASGVSKRRGILMTLKVLGESEETAVPWVFVQCDKAIAKKVRRFFKQSSVVSDFKPPSTNIHTPKLDVYVHELPPLLLGADSHPPLTPTHISPNLFEQPVVVYHEPDSYSPPSLCGKEIFVVVNGQLRSATVGGVVSAEANGGDVQYFGLTAGHFLNKETSERDLDGEAREEQEEVVEGSDEDTDDELFDDGQDFELDLDSIEEPAFTTSVLKTAAQSIALGNPSTVMGHVIWTSQDDPEDRPNLDWAIFTIEHTALKLPNIVKTNEITQTVAEDIETPRAVVLSTASCKNICGTISSSWSYLALSPGTGLVRTKAVKLAGNQVLAPGDSGAWVVDLASNQLYGHIVASDVFGVSYIVPAPDVFRDIKGRLSAQTVKLPARTRLIFETQVSRTDTISLEQVIETISNAPITARQSISESGSGQSSSDGSNLLAKPQAMARHEKLSGQPPGPFFEYLRADALASGANEAQQHKADDGLETRYRAPIQNTKSLIQPPISVPEDAHIDSETYRSLKATELFRQKMQRGLGTSTSSPRRVNVAPESTMLHRHDTPSTLKSGDLLDDFYSIGRPVGVEAVRTENPRPVVEHEHAASSSKKSGAPKSKGNILSRALQKLGMRKDGPKAVHSLESEVKIGSSGEATSRSFQKAMQSEVPVAVFSDSGYSTMANTPASSRGPSPRTSPFNSQ